MASSTNLGELWITRVRLAEEVRVRSQSRLRQVEFNLRDKHNKINNLRGGEGWARVPFPPPLALAKAFSRSGCRRIFLLLSRVMREGLSTAAGAKRPGSGLSRPIFSEPVACAILVNCCQVLDIDALNYAPSEHSDFRGVLREGTEIEIPRGSGQSDSGNGDRPSCCRNALCFAVAS